MKIIFSLVSLVFALCSARTYPGYYPYHGSNYDTLAYGSSDSSRGGMVMSRYFNPYSAQSRDIGGGMAAFMFKQPEEQYQTPQSSGQYYLADRRRQTAQEENYYPQQNEVYYPQGPVKAGVTELTEFAEPTEKTDYAPTTLRATVLPELAEPEVEEIEETVQKAKKRVSKKKQVKKPVDDDEDDDDYSQPRMPNGAFFPMFFAGRSGSGMPGGATAIANAYSTGRGGVATSHATAYGAPRPDTKYHQ